MGAIPFGGLSAMMRIVDFGDCPFHLNGCRRKNGRVIDGGKIGVYNN